MKALRSVLRPLTVCSSLLLAGGLIAYRSGAFTGLKLAPADEEIQFSGSKSIRITGLVPVTMPTDIDGPEPATAAGSPRFDFNASPPPLLTPAPRASDLPAPPWTFSPTAPPPPAMLPGSKSLGNLGVGRAAIQWLFPELFPPKPRPFSTAIPPGL